MRPQYSKWQTQLLRLAEQRFQGLFHHKGPAGVIAQVLDGEVAVARELEGRPG